MEHADLESARDGQPPTFGEVELTGGPFDGMRYSLTTGHGRICFCQFTQDPDESSAPGQVANMRAVQWAYDDSGQRTTDGARVFTFTGRLNR